MKMDLKSLYDMGEQLCQMATSAGYSPSDSSNDGDGTDAESTAEDTTDNNGADDTVNSRGEQAGPDAAPSAAPGGFLSKKKGSMLDTAMAMMKGA